MSAILTLSATTVIESSSAHNLKAAGYMLMSLRHLIYKVPCQKAVSLSAAVHCVYLHEIAGKRHQDYAAAAVLNNQKHLYKHQTAGYHLLFCLFIQQMSDYSSSPLLCLTASFPTFFVGKVAFQVLCVHAFLELF